MKPNEVTPRINPYLFEKQFEAFQKFVEEKSNMRFISFTSNPYTYKQEGYKDEIYKEARDKLNFQTWQESEIGRGNIVSATIKSIELKNNNLVQWQSRYGDGKRPHHPLYQAKADTQLLFKTEKCLFKLYHKMNVVDSFNELIDIFRKKYALIAYLFFIKDKSKYLPIATQYFDSGFKLLGSNFKTSHQCSMKNYYQYLFLIGELKLMLSETLSSDVSLLDAHSFAWILSSQMKK